MSSLMDRTSRGELSLPPEIIVGAERGHSEVAKNAARLRGADNFFLANHALAVADALGSLRTSKLLLAAYRHVYSGESPTAMVRGEFLKTYGVRMSGKSMGRHLLDSRDAIE